MEKSSKVESKRYVVFSNERGTQAELVEFKWPSAAMALSADGLSPIGVVYDHAHDVYGNRVDANVVGKPLGGNPEISGLVGQILTIADALFVDKEQREAFKSLLRQTIYGYANDKEEQVRQVYQVAKRDIK